MNDQQTIKQRYETKILGVRNYESDKATFNVDDFSEIESLQHVLEEVFNGESDLTPAGQAFLADYYGYKVLATRLVERGSHLAESSEETSVGKKVDTLSSWLETIEPMEAAAFIAEQRGETADKESLPESFLPPKN